MPLKKDKRKLTRVGASKGLTLPVDWVRNVEERSPTEEVTLNLTYDDDFVLITPEGQQKEKTKRLVALLEVI